MKFIAHRINKVEELMDIPEEYGIEIDLRPYQDKLILEHDPFVKGDLFEDWIKEFKHQTLILNIKSERIEFKVLELLKKYRIEDYFFLDCSFPMINLLSGKGEKNIALRFSEFEGIYTLRKMSNKVRWVWVDCFNNLPIDSKIYFEIQELNYKLCLVSPELQGRPQDIPLYAKQIKRENIEFDAICTKIHNIESWKKLL